MNRTLLNRSPAELIAMATGRRGSGVCPSPTGRKLGTEKTGRCRDGRVREVWCGDGTRRRSPNCRTQSEYESTPKITSPATAIQYCRQQFSRLARESKQEEFWIVTLNTKNQPIDRHQITVGTLRNSLVHPREVFRPAIRDAANCILVLHNHPSGDPTPSDQDISVTERLEQTAEVIGIPVIDHIIVAGDKAVKLIHGAIQLLKAIWQFCRLVSRQAGAGFCASGD